MRRRTYVRPLAFIEDRGRAIDQLKRVAIEMSVLCNDDAFLDPVRSRVLTGRVTHDANQLSFRFDPERGRISGRGCRFWSLNRGSWRLCREENRGFPDRERAFLNDTTADELYRGILEIWRMEQVRAVMDS